MVGQSQTMSDVSLETGSASLSAHNPVFIHVKMLLMHDSY